MGQLYHRCGPAAFLEAGRYRRYINSIPANLKRVDGDTAKLALDYNLVDQLKTRTEVRYYLAELSGSDQEQINLVSLSNYLSQVEPSFNGSGSSLNQVGLIIAQGTIVDGPSQPGTMGLKRSVKNFAKRWRTTVSKRSYSE